MKLVQGFRIPEPRDKAIEWPSRGQNAPTMAIWRQNSACWLVPGVERAYEDPRELVNIYGNDWYVLWIQRAAVGVES
jgi:hypothetical protein